MNPPPDTTSPLDQLDPQTAIQNQSLASSSSLSLATKGSLEPDSTRSLVNLPTVISGDSPPGTTIVSDLYSTVAPATSITSPLVVPALTLPPYLDITPDWRNYCESLGAGILAEYLAVGIDPFWMLTIRPPKNWSKEWVGQSIKAAAIAYHWRTYESQSLTNDDFAYYAAILWSHKSKRWHAHILCQRLPLYPGLLVLCLEEAVNGFAGTIDLKDHDNLRALASENPDWLSQIHPVVDYRTYLAGRRNITGHYGWDPKDLHGPHVDLYSPVLKYFPERERLAIVAESMDVGSTATSGSKQTVPGYTGSQKVSQGASRFGRKWFRGMRLESCTIEDRCGMVVLYCIFRDDEGLTYRWKGSNPEPVNVRGYRRDPGRYRLIPGVTLDFRANIYGNWPDGTIRISRPYFRLDTQPDAAKREYARKYSIPLEDLGLDSEEKGSGL
jgi:hypothetical protein